MEIKLKLSERIHLLGLLPLAGAYENLILSKSIKGKIEINATEIEEFEIKTTDSMLSWNSNGSDCILKIDLLKKEAELIGKLLKDASEKESLAIDLLGVYEIFHLDDNTSK